MNLKERNALLLGMVARTGKKIYDSVEFWKVVESFMIGVSELVGAVDNKVRYSAEYNTFSIGISVEKEDGTKGVVYVRVKGDPTGCNLFKVAEVEATREFNEANIKAGDRFLFAYPVKVEAELNENEG